MNPALLKVLASTGLKVATADSIRRAQKPVRSAPMRYAGKPVGSSVDHPPLERYECDPFGNCHQWTQPAPALDSVGLDLTERLAARLSSVRPSFSEMRWLNEEMQRRCLDQAAFGRIVQRLTDESVAHDSVGLGPAIIFSPTNMDWHWFGLRDLRHRRFKGWIYMQGRTALRLTTGHYLLYWAGVGWNWRKCLPAGTPAENSAAVFGQYTWLLCDTEAAWALHESDQAYTLPGHTTAKWKESPWDQAPTFFSDELELFAYEG